MPSKSRGAVLALALSGVVAAGCGGADHSADNHYVDQVNQAQREFAGTVQGLSGATTPTSSAGQRKAALARFQGAIATIVGRFGAIKPPARVAALHRQLIAQIEGFGTEVRAATATLASHNAAKLQAASTLLLRQTTRTGTQISGTIDSINHRLHG